MGRYYSGDIEGKFWFGLQSSTAADRFGVPYSEPSCVDYCYERDDLEKVNIEINRIQAKLGDKLSLIKDFYNNKDSNSEKLESIGVDNHDLSEYADLLLGIKIRDCIKENGSCYFTAEL